MFRWWCVSFPREGPYPRLAFSSFRTAETVLVKVLLRRRCFYSVQTELPHPSQGRGRVKQPSAPRSSHTLLSLSCPLLPCRPPSSSLCPLAGTKCSSRPTPSSTTNSENPKS